MKEFDGLDYTREALAEELSLVELHAADGSALKAGCACIEEKHLLRIAGLATEGVSLAKDQDEKEYYIDLAERMRAERKRILDADFKKKVAGNPRTRAFLPHGLTECEKSHPAVKKKLAHCIEATEIKCCGEHTADYADCTCNPVAVCRAAVPCK